MSPREARWRLGARDSLGLVPWHLQAQAPRREGRPWAHTALFERVDPVSHSGHLGVGDPPRSQAVHNAAPY